MNIHVNQEIREKFPQYDWIGKSWRAGNLTWIRILHRTLNYKLRFCFELECAVDVTMYQFIVKNGYFG